MNMMKILALAFLFIGESLAIYAEIVAAKNITNFSGTFLKMAVPMTRLIY
jgi:hypothetical protein